MNNNMAKVVLYSTGCPVCKMLKAKLDASGIQYLTVTDKAAMDELGISSVPVLMVDGTLMTAPEAIKWINQEAVK